MKPRCARNYPALRKPCGRVASVARDANPLLWLVLGVAGVSALLWSKQGRASVMNEPSSTPLPPTNWRAPLSTEQRANLAKYQPYFQSAAARYGIPLELLLRQGFQESRFRTDIITGVVRSKAGAIGIMQIIPRWHPELDAGDAAADERAALDPPRAIEYAAKFMRSLYRQFGRWDVALAAYNAGPGNVAKYGGVPPFPETIAYVRDITRDAGVVA